MRTPGERAALGGRARAAALTPEQRAASARTAVQARWAKARSAPTATITMGGPPKPAATWVTLVIAGRAAPRFAAAAGSWAVHARTVVLTPARRAIRTR